jgi:hypothetical protein
LGLKHLCPLCEKKLRASFPNDFVCDFCNLWFFKTFAVIGRWNLMWNGELDPFGDKSFSIQELFRLLKLSSFQ